MLGSVGVGVGVGVVVSCCVVLCYVVVCAMCNVSVLCYVAV